MKAYKLLFILFLLSSSSIVLAQNRLYQNPNFPAIAMKHEKIAILPFDATVNMRPKQMEKTTPEQLEIMARDEGLTIQQSMYSWFLTRQQRGEVTVSIQNPVETNALLKRNGFEYDNLDEITPKEIAALLEVDAVIMGKFETSKPMSEGAAVALSLLVGFWGNTDKAVINMFIYNGEDGETLFNYHRAINGSLGTNSDNLINKLMRKSSRKMAYSK